MPWRLVNAGTRTKVPKTLINLKETMDGNVLDMSQRWNAYGVPENVSTFGGDNAAP